MTQLTSTRSSRVDLTTLAELAISAYRARTAARVQAPPPLSFASLAPAAALLAIRLAPRFLPRSRPSHRNLWVAAGAGIIAAGLARWQLQRFFTAEPDHDVEQRIGPIEIRQYAPLRIARTTVRGKGWDDALNEGFHRLAGFIFGGNTAGRKIAMTAPVTSTRDGDGHRFAFVMPDDDALPLPAPSDRRVALDQLPSRRVAVLRFNGRHDESAIDEKTRELLLAVGRAGFTPRGTPSFAGYDPPTTLPLLRRNEVWIEVEQ
jgi:DNA gyrase inhibitor GyrI